MKKLSAAGVGLWIVMLASTAMAQTKPFRADGGLQAATQSGWTGNNGVPGLYYKVSSGWWVRKPDNTEVGPLGTGGGGSTLALTYAAGSVAADSILSLDSTRGRFRLKDNATPLGTTLFDVTDSAGTSTYFGVTAAATGQAVASFLDGASAGVSAAGQGNLIYNNTTHTFQQSLNGGAYSTIGGGGASTLALTYAAGATQADSTFSLDSTRLGLIVKDAASTVGSLLKVQSNGGGAVFLNISGGAAQTILSNAVDGASAVAASVNTSSAWVNATAKPFQVLNNSVEKFSVLASGSLNLVANASLLGASSATNTTGLTLNPNVADGASSIATKLNNTTATATVGFKDLSVQQNAVEQWFVGYPVATTIPEFRGAGVNVGIRNSNGDGLMAQGANNVYIYGAGATQVNWLANNGYMPTQGGLYNGKTSASNFWGSTVSQHFAGAGTAPTKAAGACIGGTQTVTLDANASDSSGNITLTGTATGTASSTCATVTFNNGGGAWGTAPHCSITSSNAAAAALSGGAALFVDSASTTTSVFVIKVGATALVAGTYIFTYDCMQ